MAEGQPGGDWTDEQNDLIVADYFEMLGLELSGQPFVKAHRNTALQELTGRSRRAIEQKHMNISAVVTRLGLPRIKGYAICSATQLSGQSDCCGRTPFG